MDEYKAKVAKIMDELRKAHNMFDFDMVLELTNQLEKEKEKWMNTLAARMTN